LTKSIAGIEQHTMQNETSAESLSASTGRRQLVVFTAWHRLIDNGDQEVSSCTSGSTWVLHAVSPDH